MRTLCVPAQNASVADARVEGMRPVRAAVVARAIALEHDLGGLDVHAGNPGRVARVDVPFHVAALKGHVHEVVMALALSLSPSHAPCQVASTIASKWSAPSPVP